MSGGTLKNITNSLFKELQYSEGLRYHRAQRATCRTFCGSTDYVSQKEGRTLDTFQMKQGVNWGLNCDWELNPMFERTELYTMSPGKEAKHNLLGLRPQGPHSWALGHPGRRHTFTFSWHLRDNSKCHMAFKFGLSKIKPSLNQHMGNKASFNLQYWMSPIIKKKIQKPIKVKE